MLGDSPQHLRRGDPEVITFHPLGGDAEECDTQLGEGARLRHGACWLAPLVRSGSSRGEATEG